jgi:hypothetical protein
LKGLMRAIVLRRTQRDLSIIFERNCHDLSILNINPLRVLRLKIFKHDA